ncbi:hypothetical protein GBN14_00850 [Plesiomonas shigelloides]|nr:hypothetical protein GBN14_00850 [Plesiomonas shigelloides]
MRPFAGSPRVGIRSCLLSLVSCLLSLVSCLLSLVSCLLSLVSCLFVFLSPRMPLFLCINYAIRIRRT